MDATKLQQDAVKFARLAVVRDEGGEYPEAVFFYKEAAQALLYALQAGSRTERLAEKAHEYLDRVEVLQATVQASSGQRGQLKSAQQVATERAYFLCKKAFEAEEKNNEEEAADLYKKTKELCINTKNATADKDLQSKLNKLAEQAEERAEKLKGASNVAAVHSESDGAQRYPSQPVRRVPPLGFDFNNEGGGRGPAGPGRPGGGRGPGGPSKPHGPPPSATESYRDEEITVLRTTSLINGLKYVPFLELDLKERFAFPIPFSDEHGKLALAPKQKDRFARWVRPSDICTNPTVIYAISSFSIKQTVVSDCSFVASLAISAAYERRYKKQLITSIIFPQNKRGEPEYNPCGKYMVKLHINGVARKVIIDDYLPVDHSGELLCSYSTNHNELWVSLIEKAYMKVMGGYDFPGSNSNIDLHALTGWIPERISMHSEHQLFNKEATFNMLQQRFHHGDVLITIATGVMTDEEGEQRGLVPTHAYAVLDIREAQGVKFLQLKNPWSHLRWKGRYSERDEKNWTLGLQKALNYDLKKAQKTDDGVFWIDWEAACAFYDVIYLSWNPSIFPETTCLHSQWSSEKGPVRDAYSLGNNPQYRLEVQCPQGGAAAVWVLLTRHITDKDDFAENKVFFTLLVYKTNGKKIYYPSDPAPYIDGIRINSPHYLTKLTVKDPGKTVYTLVVSQYEKHNTIQYTLRVYGSAKFNLLEIPFPFTKHQRITGKWEGSSAGGCSNYRDTYKSNPMYQLRVDKKGPLLVEIRGPKQYSVGFELVVVSTEGDAGAAFSRKGSGDYRSGFCYLELESLPAGIYNLIPTTFLPGQEGPFFLDIHTAAAIKVSKLQG